MREDFALAKAPKLLRPNGRWAMVWNVFGDDSRPDSFHEATKALLDGPWSPSAEAAGLFEKFLEIILAGAEAQRALDKDGNVLLDEPDKGNRWANPFGSFLARNDQRTAPVS